MTITISARMVKGVPSAKKTIYSMEGKRMTSSVWGVFQNSNLVSAIRMGPMADL